MNQPICKHDKMLKQISELTPYSFNNQTKLPPKAVMVNIPAALWSEIRNYVKERKL